MEGLMVLFGLTLAGIAFLLPIVSFFLALGNQRRMRALEETVARLQRQLSALEPRAGAAPAPSVARAPAAVPREAVPAPPQPAASPPPLPAAPPPPLPPSPSQPITAATSPLPVTPLAQLPPPVAPPPARPVAPAPQTPAAARPAAAAPAPAEATRVPPRPPAPPAQRPAPPSPPSKGGGFDWESLIGVRLFSAVAGIALVFAAIFFLRYSIERGWLQPAVRVAIGVLIGVGLLVVCERRAARRYRITANALDAAAVSILFATFFAAHALWQLIPVWLTFLLLGLVAAVAVLLSIRHESLFIAVLGLLGGFSTPALLSTGENRPIPLFAYLLLLNLGLAWVARARGWPVLTGLSLALTTLYQWAWVFKFLDAAQVELAGAIFLVFPAALFGVLALARRREGKDAPAERRLQDTALFGAALPLLFTLYLAAVPGYGARFLVLFGLLLLIDVALLALGLARREFLLHLAGGLGTLVSLVVWLAQSYTSAAWPAVLGIVAVLFLVYLLAETLASALGRKTDRPLGLATLVAPLLLVALPALVALEPSVERPLPLFATAFVLLGLAAAAAIARARGSLYYVAVFFVLVAEAAWSARYLTPERLGSALLLYLAFGLACLGIPVLARRLERPLVPRWGGGAVLIAALVLLLYLADHRVAPGALFGLALLLAILNAGLFVETAAARLPALGVVGGFLSWIVLGAWWLEGASSVALLPALAVVTGLALLMLAGHVWVESRATAPATRGFSIGDGLGLVAHVFLLAVAADSQLGIPPGPVFAALAVLALAFAGAALYLRAGAFHAAATLAGAIVLLTWIASAPTAGWCSVGLLALAALAAFTLVAMRLGRTTRDTGPAWSAAAVIALLALHFGAMLSSGSNAPSTAVLAAAHVAALGALLAVATARGWLKLGLLAVATSAFAALVFATLHGSPGEWPARLGLAAAIYAVFLAWPFAAGDSAVASREPWLAAILASAPFFFLARQALVAGGYKPVIGTLPLAQAVAMALLLRRLLAVEPARGRDSARLALVAGAALAFVTLAIPLQLEKQWITIGWALEGAALAWLYRRIAHRGLLLTSAGLLVAAFVRLAANPEIFRYAPRSEVPIFNWYLYTYLACVAALVIAGRLLRPADDRLVAGLPRASTAAFTGAGVLLFLLLNIEIADFYAEGPTVAFSFGARLDQDLTYTIGWLVFGLGVLAVGIVTRSRGARLAALALVTVTGCKGFLYDLSRLGGLYRVASFVGLAVALSLVALALQKYVLAGSKEKA
jgi:uncharacterized membrane protein